MEVLVILAFGVFILSKLFNESNHPQNKYPVYKEPTMLPKQDSQKVDLMAKKILKLEKENKKLQDRLFNVETIITDEQFQVRLPAVEDDLERKIQDLVKQKEYLKKMKSGLDNDQVD